MPDCVDCVYYICAGRRISFCGRTGEKVGKTVCSNYEQTTRSHARDCKGCKYCIEQEAKAFCQRFEVNVMPGAWCLS